MSDVLDDRDLDAIERRIAAASAVRQAVHAFWALARAQLPHAEQAARNVAAYHLWTDDVVERLSGTVKPRDQPAKLLVVFGPERPFCGGLPAHVLAALPDEGDVGLVGRRLADVVKRDPRVADRVRFALPAATVVGDQHVVARAVARASFEVCPSGDVELVYPRAGERTLVRAHFIAATREEPPEPPETFSPPEVVRNAALVEANAVLLAVATLETLHAEVRARVIAAETAKSACDRRLETLGEARRGARRDLITRELLEIVAGAEALLPGAG
jgi:F0F1-type ATP synthase gamma subunit